MNSGKAIKYPCECEDDICILKFPIEESIDNIKRTIENLGLKIYHDREVDLDYLPFENVIFLEEVNLVIAKSKDVKNLIQKRNAKGVIQVVQSHFKILSDVIRQVEYKITPPQIGNTNWGMRYTKAIDSNLTGEGVNVAILDSGFDHLHPEYVDSERVKSIKHYIDDDHVDYNGHGMHCLGIACGDKDNQGLRYGVANKSSIFPCKVLDDNNEGRKSNIIRGILWAVRQNCRVINVSYTIENENNEPHDTDFERVIQYAFSKNSIVVAAVGNKNYRPQKEDHLIGSPSDSPTCVAVSGINEAYGIYFESNRAETLALKQKINVTAPASNIYSSWSTESLKLQTKKHSTLSGTSMATAFVSGILTLLWEKYKDKNPTAAFILNKLETTATIINQGWKNCDVGYGLVQAPKNRNTNFKINIL